MAAQVAMVSRRTTGTTVTLSPTRKFVSPPVGTSNVNNFHSKIPLILARHLQEAWGAPTHKQQCGFWGPGHMGLATAMWVPMGTRVPILSPNDSIAHHGANMPKTVLLGANEHHQEGWRHMAPHAFMCTPVVTK